MLKKVLSLVFGGIFLATAAFGAGVTKHEAGSLDAASSVLYGTADAGDTIVRVKTDSDGTINANITGDVGPVDSLELENGATFANAVDNTVTLTENSDVLSWVFSGSAIAEDYTGVTERVFNEAGADVDFRVETDDYSDGFTINANDNIASGCIYATQNTHHEIGDYLATLTSPVAIVGLTGTMADASTETGYESGSGRTWTYNNTTTADKITEGNTYVIDMDGTDDYLSTPDTDDMSFDDSGSNPFSVGGWVQVDTTGSQTILSKWDASSGSEAREWDFELSSGAPALVCYDESANQQVYRLADSALTNSTWYFVVITYDSTGGATAMNGVTVYVNGVEVASTASNDGSYVAMENLGATPLVGARTGASSVEQLYEGDLGRLFVTPEELTAAQVWKLYEQTRGFYNK